jgi:single-strand DNA-binding protein
MLNQCQFIGNLGADPEVRRTQSGKPIVNLRLAVSKKWRDQNGERQERTTWVPIVIFNEGLCKVAEDYLKKGSKIYVSGEFSVRKWQDKDGNDRYSTEVVLQGFGGNLVMLDGFKEGEGKPTQSGSDAYRNKQADPTPYGGEIDDSEIPF